MAEVGFSLREATPRDAPVLRLLYRKVDRDHAELDPVVRAGRDDRDREKRIGAALRDPNSTLCVAVVDARVVGFVLASFEAHSRDVTVEAIYVARAERRRGLGAALIRHVERWMERKSGRYVHLDVYEFNPEARAFYEALGYLTVYRHMRKDPKFDPLAHLTSHGTPDGTEPKAG